MKTATPPRLNLRSLEAQLAARLANDYIPPLNELPQPSELFCMSQAASIIASAIKAGKKIAIVGDYDVDGVVASTILSEFFAAINYPVLTKIPNRFTDGYGLSESIVSELAACGIEQIITVDNAIGAYEAAQMAANLGIELIITDHHEPGESLPLAAAVVDPKRAECAFTRKFGVEICGAQVAWWLAAAIKRELGASVNIAQWLDVLCLAISADMMPMRGLNRSLMAAGLNALNHSQKPFVQALRAQLGRMVFEYETISFYICPMLNSSGRMADAATSLEFLRAQNAADASQKLEQIAAYNAARKDAEARIFEAACEQISAQDKFIVCAGRGWHRGVIGIVAGRLANAYSRCAAVFSIDENGLALGSARSFGGANLLEIFENCKESLAGFGGHKAAAGLSASEQNLARFKELANSYVAGICELSGASEEANFSGVFGELGLEFCTLAATALLRRFEPFGCGNKTPVFCARAAVKAARMLKDKHLKLSLQPAGALFEAAEICPSADVDAIYFNYSATAKPLPQIGSQILVKFTLGENDFFSPPKPQLILSEIIPQRF